LVRTLNGIAVIGGSTANYSVGTNAMIWPEETGNYTVGAISVSDGGSLLLIEICPFGSNATPTMTTTPTAPPLPCPIADSVGIPVAPGTATLSLAAGMKFVVASATIYINIGADAREIPPGNYTWNLEAGDYTAYSLTAPATVWICISVALPTSTLGPVDIGGTPACVALVSTTPTTAFTMPDLAIVIPTLRPLGTPTGTITASISISTTAITAFAATIRAGVSTPAAAAATAAGGFSWDTGVGVAATAQAYAAPTLEWMAILNGFNPAWDVEGSALWALAPALRPITLVIALLSLVALARFLVYLSGVFLKIVDIIFKIIELIPGE
jgi:hypothetical protein